VNNSHRHVLFVVRVLRIIAELIMAVALVGNVTRLGCYIRKVSQVPLSVCRPADSAVRIRTDMPTGGAADRWHCTVSDKERGVQWPEVTPQLTYE
jgi:hypothetical protein